MTNLYPLTRYATPNTFGLMTIQSFACRDTEDLYETGTNKRFGNIATVALRKLDYLNSAAALSDLRSPPGNKLEALKRDRAGHHSIRINDQWRICFVWTAAGPAQVEICDYY
jgi:proteic killer suppression protein